MVSTHIGQRKNQQFLGQDANILKEYFKAHYKEKVNLKQMKLGTYGTVVSWVKFLIWPEVPTTVLTQEDWSLLCRAQ